MDALIAALASLFGVMVGGFITYVTSKQGLDREDERQRKRTAIDRFEQIHRWLMELDEHHQAAIGELMKRFGIDSKVDTNQIKKNPIAEVTFLIEAFLPATADKLDSVRAAQKELGELLGKAVASSIGDEDRSKYFLQTLDLDKKLQKLLDVVRKELHETVRKTHNS